MLKTSVWPRSNLFLNVFEVFRGTLPTNKNNSVRSHEFRISLKSALPTRMMRQQAEKRSSWVDIAYTATINCQPGQSRELTVWYCPHVPRNSQKQLQNRCLKTSTENLYVGMEDQTSQARREKRTDTIPRRNAMISPIVAKTTKCIQRILL